MTDVYIKITADGATTSIDGGAPISGGSVSINIPAYITSSFTVTSENLIYSSGAALMTATLPDANSFNTDIVFKHTGSQDLTIVGVMGQTIDGNANVQLRGGRKQSVTLKSNGSNWAVF